MVHHRSTSSGGALVVDFVPGVKIVRRTVVRVYMLGLPIKFWQPKILMGIG